MLLHSMIYPGCCLALESLMLAKERALGLHRSQAQETSRLIGQG